MTLDVEGLRKGMFVEVGRGAEDCGGTFQDDD